MRFNNLAPLLSVILSSCSIFQGLVFDGKAPQDISNVDNSVAFEYVEMSCDDITWQDFSRFIENIKYVYMDIAQGQHKTFHPNTEIIKNGTIIDNSEQVGDQIVSHRYAVEIDSERHVVKWVSNPSVVRIVPWDFSIDVATVLTLKFQEGTLNTHLAIIFGSERDLKASLKTNMKQLWGNHNNIEMSNAFNVLKYLKKSKQLYNQPSTWNIDAIRSEFL